ncbi:SH3 domain-containing kinase-binding protein 1 isoform X1 [Entelurus aequoreus]|uniref:SH3 domain-containing kinase-binding protein 1 isoform X1 n=1 Tax=Entelurus aequoreus TaxID=161455 RepID=UPI002B1E65E5|nr:SH3 domain-containing kinase-binding protein 1 isoform X1 [Entelurus aequoreus]XP_061876920.1 SH3 domain-containing kinase-binding protein 1 isoform X1 [Entelurus aequoreus]
MVEAVVEFDYEAQQDDELSLNVGDVVVNIRRDDGGWWEGELGGRRGLFPDNFVREIKKEAKRDGGQASTVKSDLSNGRASPVSEPSTRSGKKGEQIRKRRCKAAFSYVPQHEDELELKIGDVIDIVAEVEEGWWEGVLGGKSGMFPSNFTKEILLDLDGHSGDTSQEDLHSRTSKNSPGSESDGGDSLKSETGSVEIQPKKVRGFGFGDIFKDQPIKLRPRSVDADSEGDKVVEGKTASASADNMKGDSDGRGKGAELCKVLFPYEAQNEDELTIKEGEIVAIVTKDCADTGWWMGEIGGRQGVFPDNFVKLLEAEKKRPKKPPPPSAPSAKHTADKKSDVKKVPPERPEQLPQRDQDRGEEVNVGDLPKPSLPSVLPKKPFLTKTSSSSSSSQPPRRPERPPTLACESPKSEGGASTPDSALDRSHDTDLDLDAVVPSAEKLSHPTATRPRVTDRRPRSQIITSLSLSSADVDHPAPEDRKDRDRNKEDQEPVQFARKGLPAISVPEGKAPLAAKSSSSLNPPNCGGHRPASPSSSSGLSPTPELRNSPVTPPTLEDLRYQVRELRTSVELLKSQHRQEMKQLTNTLDEEKKIRLGLQMEVEHIKKKMSK